MTNREKFKEQILDIACSGSSIAVDINTMKPDQCSDFDCFNCYFHPSSDDENHDCNDMCKMWCNSEYVEPPVDWSKVPVDTPILVRDNESNEWLRRYFARYEKGQVYAWSDGANSWSAENKTTQTMDWKYAKLAESED